MSLKKVSWLVSWLVTIGCLVPACAPGQRPEPPAEAAQLTRAEEHDAGRGDEQNPEAMLAELEPVALGPDEKLKVVATTNVIADLVSHVGGDRIELTGLLPVGADPHTFSPTPRDVSAVADAQVVFANGLGLEEFLDGVLENAGGKAPVIALSQGIETRELGSGEERDHGEEGPHHEGVDPHTWSTPANALVFVRNIRQALSALDPANAETYAANAEAYETQLEALDAWIIAQVETIPAEDRKLVTDHDSFGYYVDRYGLELVGAVIPAYSTNAEPSAQELAGLQDAIGELGVKAVFVGTTVNPVLAERVAQDTGTRLVPLYTGSLGEPGSGVESYIDYVCYNTTSVVEALGGAPDVAGSPCE